MARATASETGAAPRTALALLARQATAPEVPRKAVRGDVRAGDVLRAMELIAARILAAGWPEDGGADMLARIGLAVADLGDEP